MGRVRRRGCPRRAERARSSGGQSAALIRPRPLVRVQARPPGPGETRGWEIWGCGTRGRGAVAQLGERRPCTAEVRGSSPRGSTRWRRRIAGAASTHRGVTGRVPRHFDNSTHAGQTPAWSRFGGRHPSAARTAPFGVACEQQQQRRGPGPGTDPGARRIHPPGSWVGGPRRRAHGGCLGAAGRGRAWPRDETPRGGAGSRRSGGTRMGQPAGGDTPAPSI